MRAATSNAAAAWRWRVEIDLNVRVRGNQTYSGFEHGGVLCSVGDEVIVYEPESGAEGTGRVTDVDYGKRLVYMAVDWPSLRVRPPEQEQQ